MKSTTLIKRLISFSLPLVFLTACSFSLAADVTPPPGSDVSVEMPTQAPLAIALFPAAPPDPAAGAPIFAEKCAPCHGETGQGDGPDASQLPNPPSALGDPEIARQARPADWYDLVTQGNIERFMPPFNSLSDAQRWDVVAYALTLNNPSQNLSQGEVLYQANCATCHGEGGQGDGPEAVSLATTPTDFTDQELMAQRSSADLYQATSAGVPPDMPAFETQLSEAERWALADYLRSFAFASAPTAAAPPAQGTPVPQETAAEITGSPQPTSGTAAALGTPEAVTGVITGRVVNASGGEVPAGLEVTLHGFDEMQQAFTATAQASSDGSYTFENVEMPQERAFIASLKHNGVVYSSDVAVIEPGMSTLDLEIPFYETSSDTSQLVVDRLHLVMEYLAPDTLRVVELYVVSNPTQSTIVGAADGEPVLKFSLPEGATNLQFEDGQLGERYVQLENGFGDLSPVRPGLGEHQVVFSYDLPYTGRLDFSQPVELPVSAVILLIPEDGIKVRSNQLADMGTRDVQGVVYHTYSSEPVEAGSNLEMTLSGKPGAGSLIPVVGSNASLVVGLAAVGLVLLLLGVWLLRRSRASAVAASVAEGQAGATGELPVEDSEELLDALLALDDRYQAGEIPEQAYRQRRAELKARLKEQLGK